MNALKLRNTLTLLHLFGAGFMAPAFLLLAISGGLYLTGNKGKFESVPVALPAAVSLDFTSPDLETDVRALLKSNNMDTDFEYIRNRGSVIQLRPTSRTHYEFKQTQEGLTATQKKPNLQATLMELHKGHGPKLFKTYQKLVALFLFFVVFGGVFVGLLAKNYRRKTLASVVIGTIVFVLLGFIL